MIKKLLTSAITILAISANAQSFSAKYNFASTTSLTGVTDPTTPPTITGLTTGSFTAVGTGTASSAAGRFSFNTWGVGAPPSATSYSTMTGAVDLGKYYQVMLTPASGYVITLNNATFTSQRSGTGVRSYAVRTSADSYSLNLPASVGTSTNLSVQGVNEFFFNADITSAQTDNSISFSAAAFTNFSSALTIRFYAFNSEATTGTFSLDSVIFNGTATLATGLGSVKFDLNSNFNIYPVPSNDGVVFIENQNATEISKIDVIDVLGNIVLTNATTNDTKVKLNLATVPSGSYFVRITSGKNTSVKRIMISK